jgi:hypothetical protein
MVGVAPSGADANQVRVIVHVQTSLGAGTPSVCRDLRHRDHPHSALRGVQVIDDAGGPGANVLPVAKVAILRWQRQHDRPLREAQPSLVQLPAKTRWSRAAVASTTCAASTGVLIGLRWVTYGSAREQPDRPSGQLCRVPPHEVCRRLQPVPGVHRTTEHKRVVVVDRAASSTGTTVASTPRSASRSPIPCAISAVEPCFDGVLSPPSRQVLREQPVGLRVRIRELVRERIEDSYRGATYPGPDVSRSS